MCEKSAIRKEMQRLRLNLDEKQVLSYSEKIGCQILQLEDYQNANAILFYAAIRNEVQLDFLVRDALKQGKEVYFPKVFGSEMDFFQIKSLEELRKGTFGVPEPSDESHPFDGKNGLLIAPGLAFSDAGYRIGYGKGYYDRYLAMHKDLQTIGVGYSFQFHQEFETDPFDIALQKLISENGSEI